MSDLSTSDAPRRRLGRGLSAMLGSGPAYSESEPAAAEAVESVLRHFDGDRYALGEFVVMPNHVHLLVTPAPDWELSQLEQSWKSISAKRINALRGATGSIWQHESFDRIVRSAADLVFYERYIRGNPIQARLQPGSFRAGCGTFGSGDRRAANCDDDDALARKRDADDASASERSADESSARGARASRGCARARGR